MFRTTVYHLWNTFPSENGRLNGSSQAGLPRIGSLKVGLSRIREPVGGEPMTMRKTPKMVTVEKRLRRPLEKALPEMINDNGLTATAKRLGVSKATLSYWLLKLGITLRRVALAPGETIEVKRVSD